MNIRIINIALIAVAALALSSCAGLMKQMSGDTDSGGSFNEMAMPAVAGANLTADQHERVGDGYAENDHREQAYLHYAKALAAVGLESPEGLTLRTKSGLLIMAQGLDEQALSEFQKVLAVDPNHALANQAAGEVYLRSGLVQEAKAHLERALENDPYLWKAHHLLGVLHSRQNRFDLAVEEYNSALALAPDQAETLNNLGVAQLAQSRYADALNAFQRALKAGAPKEKTYNNIGLALARMGKDKEALEAFKFAGDEAKAYNNLGYVLLLTGDTQRAVTCFEKAIQVSPAYYTKAFENLKQARMAEQFRMAGLDRAPSQAVPAAFSPEDARLAPDPRPLNEAELPEVEVGRNAAPVVAPASLPVVTPASATVAPSMPAAPVEPAVQNKAAEEAESDEPVQPGITKTETAPEVSEADTPAVNNAPEEAEPAILADAELDGAAASPAKGLKPRGISLHVEDEALEAASDSAQPLYALHVSSFKTKKRADAEVADVAAKGVEAFIVRTDLGEKGQWYRVLAGRYETRALAKKDAERTASLLGLNQLFPIEFKEPPLNMPPSESEGPVL